MDAAALVAVSLRRKCVGEAICNEAQELAYVCFAHLGFVVLQIQDVAYSLLWVRQLVANVGDDESELVSRPRAVDKRIRDVLGVVLRMAREDDSVENDTNRAHPTIGQLSITLCVVALALRATPKLDVVRALESFERSVATQAPRVHIASIARAVSADGSAVVYVTVKPWTSPAATTPCNETHRE